MFSPVTFSSLFPFNMILKVHHILHFILWLSLLFLFFHELYNFKFLKTNNKNINHPWLVHRKALDTNFDSTPFVKNHYHHHKHDRRNYTVNVDKQPEPGGSEIDPRYGVEKRLVPSGPNPLHH
uniref:CLAVATA3/ESR (CLE)-related protein 12-like n=1 Tax=Nicotiana sylvestris TaxID=4096 RepID=A0A1U7VSW5_NICSY|nr:PREDICTED: CLAVATA3/ESR (CLE)-related protein 12-like [Nicotiana sylvestris]